MKVKFKLVISVLAVTVVAAILTGSVLFAIRYRNSALYYQRRVADLESVTPEKHKELSYYYDFQHLFTVLYKTGLDVDTIYNMEERLSGNRQEIINGGVNFSSVYSGDGALFNSVELYEHPSVSSVGEWLENMDKQVINEDLSDGEDNSNHYVIVNRGNIEGHEAVTIRDDITDSANEYSTAFFRGKELFVIISENCTYDEHVKFLDGFSLVDPDIFKMPSY